MRRLAWVLGLALVLALATAGLMWRHALSEMDAAERRAAEAARGRMRELHAIKLRLDTFVAWKEERSAKSRLIERLRPDQAVSAVPVLVALAGRGHTLRIETFSAGGDHLVIGGRAGSQAELERLARALQNRKAIRSFEVRRFEAGAFTLALRPAAPPPDDDELDAELKKMLAALAANPPEGGPR